MKFIHDHVQSEDNQEIRTSVVHNHNESSRRDNISLQYGDLNALIQRIPFQLQSQF